MQRSHRHVSLLVLGLIALLPLLGGAAERAHAEDRVTINVAEGVEIEQLLKMVSQQGGVPLMWDPADKQIRGKKVIGGINLSIPKSKLIDEVRAMLTFYELVMVPIGPEGYELILVMDARRTTAILKLKAKNIVLTNENLTTYAGADGLYVTTLIRVEHMKDLRNARNALTRIVTGQNIGNVVEVPDIPGFVITDFAPNVVAIYRLIKQMDQPRTATPPTSRRKPAPKRPTIEFRAIMLKHANALEAAGTLSSLFPAPRPASASRAAVVSGPSIRGDARTNQLLITGTTTQIEKVMEAVAAIDSASSEPEVHAHLIRLENMQAREAANAISQAIGTSRKLWRDPSNPNSYPSVVAVERVNGLIVSASHAAFNHIRRLIVEMDDAAGEGKADDK